VEFGVAFLTEIPDFPCGNILSDAPEIADGNRPDVVRDAVVANIVSVAVKDVRDLGCFLECSRRSSALCRWIFPSANLGSRLWSAAIRLSK
jgi:hypothetical protein